MSISPVVCTFHLFIYIMSIHSVFVLLTKCSEDFVQFGFWKWDSCLWCALLVSYSLLLFNALQFWLKGSLVLQLNLFYYRNRSLGYRFHHHSASNISRSEPQSILNWVEIPNRYFSLVYRFRIFRMGIRVTLFRFCKWHAINELQFHCIFLLLNFPYFCDKKLTRFKIEVNKTKLCIRWTPLECFINFETDSC